MRSATLPEEVKSQRLKEAEAHLDQAKAECSYYRDQVDESSLRDMDPSTPNSRANFTASNLQLCSTSTVSTQPPPTQSCIF